MRHSMLSVVPVLLAIAAPGAAQTRSPAPLDSAQRVALAAASVQSSRPASFVLGHKSDLSLQPAQIVALEALVRAHDDSATARMARTQARMRAAAPSPAILAAASWSGEVVDEQALRDELCRQSANTTGIAIGMMRDRRAVTSVLTPAQVAKLPRLQTEDIIKAVGRP